MKEIMEVPFGTKNKGGKDAVFVAIIAKETQPYKNYSHVEDPNMVIPMMLMLNRWDGTIGFPGGKVDEGETLVEAVVRELKEEINYDVSENDLTQVCSHSFEINTHLFAVYVSEKELKEIAGDILNAEHFVSEITGFNLVQIAEYNNGNGIEAYLKHNFALSVMEEIVILLKKLKYLEM